MGSSGTGQGMTYDEILKAKERAKKSLQEGEKKHNVFISFSSEDLDEVNLLRGQAKNENSNIEFNDWSVKQPFDSKEANYIKNSIRERIRQSSVTIVYISDKTANSKWVDWEIRESLKLNKGVVAMHKGNKPPNRVPKAISEHRVTVVPWNQQELTKAINTQSESH